MDLEKIRMMNDKELKSFINALSQKKQLFCSKCGKTIKSFERHNVNISTYDKLNGQKMRKLCSLCPDCYGGLLEYLGVQDVDWE